MGNHYLKYERYGKNEDLYRDYMERRTSGIRTKVIMKGTYGERHFMIGASDLGYPVAYLEVFEDDMAIMQHESDEWKAASLGFVNGSSNYYGGAYWDQNDHRQYIGWDYGSCGGFMGHRSDWHDDVRDDGHHWTLPEILMEIALASMEINNDNMEYELKQYT